MICTIRIPDVLQARIDAAAGDGKRSEWILEACRIRLDEGVEQRPSSPQADGSSPSPKPDIQALMNIPGMMKAVDIGTDKQDEARAAMNRHRSVADTVQEEVPICSKTWSEEMPEGYVTFECLMDKGHREGLMGKHGLRGMVRKVEA